jgi:hypothetical protein
MTDQTPAPTALSAEDVAQIVQIYVANLERMAALLEALDGFLAALAAGHHPKRQELEQLRTPLREAITKAGQMRQAVQAGSS